MTTASIFVLLLDRPRAGQRPYHAEIALMTAGLFVDTIRLVALHLELLDDGPRSCPDGRVLERRDHLKGVRAGAGPTFNDMQILSGSLEVRLGGEVGYVNDQRLTLPVAA